MKPDNELFVKQMTRKEFLRFAILAILGVFGLKNFITYLLNHQDQQRKIAHQVTDTDGRSSSGFGSSKFGV